MGSDAAVLAGATLFLCYLFFLGQIAIHNCVHANLFQARWLNKAVGSVLCSLHLVHFEGWKLAHMMHHRTTNAEGDPHRVDRPLVPYLLTHYVRIARAVWEPRRFTAAVAPPILTAAAVIAAYAAAGSPARGAVLVVALWIVPMIVSHLLVAHFNYATHVGLPTGRGRDTRNLNTGAWRIINRLTFNFYLHAEHHRKPSQPVPQFDPS